MVSQLARIGAVAALLFIFSEAEAHPFAVTTTEVEYNAESHCFEVAMRIYPEQLEQALRKGTGQAISLERTPNIDELITHYLDGQFSIESGDKAAKSKDEKTASGIRWIGKELSSKTSWLYFEIPFEGPLNGIKVKNSMFFQSNPEQLNVVHFRSNDRVASCSLTKNEPRSLVRWQSKEKGKSARVNKLLEF